MADNLKHPLIAIPLPQKTRKNGHDYVQVCRGEKGCIYWVWYKDLPVGYEVMNIRVRPRRQVKGIWLEAKEKFPSNEDFGYYAWAYRSRERAEEKFNVLEDD